MDGFSSYHNGSGFREQDFQKLSQTIETSIQKISQNVSSMQRMVQQLGTQQDSPELRSQLHQIQHYTQQLAKDTNSNLKDLSNLPLPVLHSEQRQQKLQRERLMDQFTATLNAFQSTQRNAAQKEKEQVAKTKAANFNIRDPFSDNRREPLIELQDSSGSRRQAQVQAQEEIDLQLLEQQEQSIRQLESDISDVNQIFKELGALVHEQGELVDSIEASVERTEVFVSEGAQQLTQAHTYQNKARKKKLILILIAVIILAILIGIIVYEVK